MDAMLGSVRALHACVLDDEKNGRIGPEYRARLLQLKTDIERILAVGGRDLCWRCEQPLGERDARWHERCPN